jgi:hypothetical protein
MIENPALFQELYSALLSGGQLNTINQFNTNNIFTAGLSAQRLSAVNAQLQQLETINQFNTNDIFTIGLSAQRLSAVNAQLQQLNTINQFNTNDIFTVGLSVQRLSADIVNFSASVANTLYVSISGNDNNIGRNIFAPLRTIKKACEIAHNALQSNPLQRFTIFVGTGEFVENNPILVPSNVSIHGDSLRRVSVLPQNIQHDLFWVNNSTYIWGFTFRRHFAPKAAIAFPDFSNTAASTIATSNLVTPIGGWTKPFITTSPYIQGCSSITSASATSLGSLSAGCGMRVDGSLARGFLRSMVLDSYTQFNESGKGIHIINNGYAQLVSIFTICCTEGIMCETGGSCSINNSNCSFGLSGLVATGASPVAILTGGLVSAPFRSNQIRISASTTTGTILYPGSPFFGPIDTQKIAFAPYNGLVFAIGNNSNQPLNPATDVIYTIDGNPFLDGTDYVINTIQQIRETYAPGSQVNFYLRSTVTASSHTFEYIGTGVVLSQAVPGLGGVSIPELEVVTDDVGAVFYTSTNQTGNFNVGSEFTIVQETGTIEGDTFKRSILTLVTPLVLSLEG